jgi:hypothetical protein
MFNEVNFYWNNSIDYNFIRSISPDYAVSIVTERAISGLWRYNDVKIDPIKYKISSLRS